MTRIKTPFYEELSRQVQQHGGIFNAHLHLDRAGTMAARYMAPAGVDDGEESSISLARKHSIISVLHDGPAYDPEDLKSRVRHYLDEMVACGTRRADTVVDCSNDRVGLTALNAFSELKSEYKNDLDLQIGAYNPIGFLDGEPDRWTLLCEAAEMADFIGSLPERDDTDDYPDHIGFMESCRRILTLAKDLGKPVHVHTDQRNHVSEGATELLIKAVEEVGAPELADGEPAVWAIHVISPSTYPEPRFNALLDGMLRNNIGVISCPSAAISMRQLRPASGPTFNCIARVLEMLAAGVQVRLGSDNIADVCSPAATPDLRDEIFVLSNALRFYDVDILAKLTAGVPLSKADQLHIASHLEADAREANKALAAYS